jgi:hypothetical protein
VQLLTEPRPAESSGQLDQLREVLREALKEERLLAVVAAEARTNWRASAWLLSRMHPKVWGERGRDVPVSFNDDRMTRCASSMSWRIAVGADRTATRRRPHRPALQRSAWWPSRMTPACVTSSDAEELVQGRVDGGGHGAERLHLLLRGPAVCQLRRPAPYVATFASRVGASDEPRRGSD